jgi:hypothetical protein
MEFLDDGTIIGDVKVSGGNSAVFQTSSLLVGTHAIQALYSGDPNYPAQIASMTEVIVAPPPISPDYTLSATTPLVVASGEQGSTQVTVTPNSELDDTITLSCGSLPAYATCEVVPGQVKVSNGAPQNATVTITTKQTSANAMVSWRNGIVLACLMPWLMIGMSGTRRRIWRGMAAILLLTLAAAGVTGCGVQFNGIPSKSLATPPGTYSIAINGHGMTTGLNRTTTLTLIVKP